MKGDFSRTTGLNAKRKHYSGLLKQQGRVQLDSDWNELISIIAHQRGKRTIDTIGQCGAPIHDSGFEILHPGGSLLPKDLLITTGRFYAGGLLCETTPCSRLPIRNFGTDNAENMVLVVDDTKIDGVSLVKNDWVQLVSDEKPDGIIAQVEDIGEGTITLSPDVSSFASDHHPYLRLLLLYSKQPDHPGSDAYTPPVAGQTDLFYLDVWERHVTVIEDPALREVALGGPDTDTRSKIIAQVKVLPKVNDVACGDHIDEWNKLTKAPNGRLSTRTVVAESPDHPCQLGESGGFLGLENRLYRVEIHDPSETGTATFKWSRDNASYAYPVQEFFLENGISKRISLGQNGKDDILKIKELDWIEVSDDTTDLSGVRLGTFAQVLEINGNILTLDTNVAKHSINHFPKNHFPKIRRWDTSNQLPDKLTNITTGKSFQLEDGIEIEFSGTEFKTGDYWCFYARALTGEIEILDKEAPLGVKHHYCRLGLVTGLDDGGVEIEDCRPEFTPLTELPIGGGCCTVTVGDDEDFQDIQLAVDSLNGGPGTVCIKPGVYMIDKPITVKGRDITIKGCGGKPIIINTGVKPAVRSDPAGTIAPGNIRRMQGVVFDATTEHPLIGAKVIVKGTEIGTTSDINGRYNLTVPHDATHLQVSFIGFKSTEILIDASHINIPLEPDMVALEAVEVVEKSMIFQVHDSWDIAIHDLWCISTAGYGAKVIEVENCMFFKLHDCLLIGAGKNDPNGVITCQGLTISTSIYNNLILGRIGIRYDSVADQQLNLHLNLKIVKNIAFVLENGIFLAEKTSMVGADFEDNLLLGISKSFLGKSFFPKSLFEAARKSGLYTEEELAAVDQEKGPTFESVNKGNTDSVIGLESYMRIAAKESRLRKYGASLVTRVRVSVPQDFVERTLGHIIKLEGTVADVNITDNIIFGRAGIRTNVAFECSIDDNFILAQTEGIELGFFLGATVGNNLIVSGQHGIVFFGQMAIGFIITNNRITTPRSGITIGSRKYSSQLAYNIQIDKNIINATEVGIYLYSPALFLMDLTIVDNSITGGNQEGIFVLSNTFPELWGKLLDARSRMQCIIQRNLISAAGNGIKLCIPHCEILDNVINTTGGQNQQTGNSWGIWLMTRSCSISNNTIKAFEDKEGLLPHGGILIDILNNLVDNEQHEIDIVRNTIIGGIQNGIEIASDINGLVIEGNEIAHMTLNGIAVQEHVKFVNNLRIAGNHIHDCFTPQPQHHLWRRNAAIVLTSTTKTQVIGNRIINNARVVAETIDVDGYGAFYADQVNEIQILDNQFIDNWVADHRFSGQAIIHVPIRFFKEYSPNLPVNAGILISNNIVKGSNTKALEIGSFISYIHFRRIGNSYGLDDKAIICQNNFETPLLSMPTVQMHINRCNFSNNFVDCGTGEGAVSLGFGVYVMANGNIVSAPIIGAGFNQQIVNTIQF